MSNSDWRSFDPAYRVIVYLPVLWGIISILRQSRTANMKSRKQDEKTQKEALCNTDVLQELNEQASSVADSHKKQKESIFSNYYAAENFMNGMERASSSALHASRCNSVCKFLSPGGAGTAFIQVLMHPFEQHFDSVLRQSMSLMHGTSAQTEANGSAGGAGHVPAMSLPVWIGASACISSLANCPVENIYFRLNDWTEDWLRWKSHEANMFSVITLTKNTWITNSIPRTKGS